MRKGLFITFEGTEGSGKSTQIKYAAAYLKSRERRVLVLREPGGTRISEVIRKLLLNKEHTEMASATELLLYLAARAQIVNEKILPALKKGQAVICDRFEDSTLAYQGFGRGISLKQIYAISRLVRGNLKPDRTFLLDITPEEGRRRVGKRDRMERQSLAFHKKVRKGFLSLAKKYKKRFVVIDARKSRAEIAREIKERLP